MFNGGIVKYRGARRYAAYLSARPKRIVTRRIVGQLLPIFVRSPSHAFVQIANKSDKISPIEFLI